MTDEHEHERETPFTPTSLASFLAWKEHRLAAARKKLKKAFAESESAAESLREAQRAFYRAGSDGDAAEINYATEQLDEAQTRNANAQRDVLAALKKFREVEDRATLDEYLQFKQENAIGGRP